MPPIITLLGTGGPKPDPERMATTTLIQTDGNNYLFDAGRGVTTRLVQAGVKPQDLDAIFITHHHFDHIGNLGELLLSIWNNGRAKPLPIYGPKGIIKIIGTLLTQVYETDIAFRHKEAAITGDALYDINSIYEITEIDQGQIIDLDANRISCERVSHGHNLGTGKEITNDNFPCLGYRIETSDKSIVISGDTVDCDGLGILAQNADLLILCCYLAKDEQTDFEQEIISKHILVSSEEAGKIAAKYQVKALAITHIRQKSPDMLSRMEADIANDYSGNIIMGKDLLQIEL